VTIRTATPADWGRSLWLSRGQSPASPALRGALETDVAVVGAGVAGVSTAFHLAALDIKVVVLEAARRPFAATAASAGVIAPQLARLTPGDVLARLGAEAGSRFLRLLAESGRYLFDLVTAERIACDARPAGFLGPAAGERAADRLGGLIAAWSPFRQDLALADGPETWALTGADGYDACLIDPTGGGVDPVAFVQGLAGALPKDRARLFRDSEVVSIARRGERWVLATDQGTLTARRVVLCANGANARLHPALARTVLPLPVYQVATAPLAASARGAILPLGHALTDASSDVFSIRFDAEGRLITACPGLIPRDRDALTRTINRRLAARLPAYRETSLDYGWRGVAWLNPSLLPRVVAVEEGLLAVQACNGRGLALNTIIGREVARMLRAPGVYEPAIPLERPSPVRGHALARHIPGLMMTAAAFARRSPRREADRAGR
jgi:glycine/D-amino acid oxidase-like deaminating enzyme